MMLHSTLLAKQFAILIPSLVTTTAIEQWRVSRTLQNVKSTSEGHKWVNSEGMWGLWDFKAEVAPGQRLWLEMQTWIRKGKNKTGQTAPQMSCIITQKDLA